MDLFGANSNRFIVVIQMPTYFYAQVQRFDGMSTHVLRHQISDAGNVVLRIGTVGETGLDTECKSINELTLTDYRGADS